MINMSNPRTTFTQYGENKNGDRFCLATSLNDTCTIAECVKKTETMYNNYMSNGSNRTPYSSQSVHTIENGPADLGRNSGSLALTTSNHRPNDQSLNCTNLSQTQSEDMKQDFENLRCGRDDNKLTDCCSLTNTAQSVFAYPTDRTPNCSTWSPNSNDQNLFRHVSGQAEKSSNQTHSEDMKQHIEKLRCSTDDNKIADCCSVANPARSVFAYPTDRKQIFATWGPTSNGQNLFRHVSCQPEKNSSSRAGCVTNPDQSNILDECENPVSCNDPQSDVLISNSKGGDDHTNSSMNSGSIVKSKTPVKSFFDIFHRPNAKNSKISKNPVKLKIVSPFAVKGHPAAKCGNCNQPYTHGLSSTLLSLTMKNPCFEAEKLI